MYIYIYNIWFFKKQRHNIWTRHSFLFCLPNFQHFAGWGPQTRVPWKRPPGCGGTWEPFGAPCAGMKRSAPSPSGMMAPNLCLTRDKCHQGMLHGLRAQPPPPTSIVPSDGAHSFGESLRPKQKMISGGVEWSWLPNCEFEKNNNYLLYIIVLTLDVKSNHILVEDTCDQW